MENHNTPQVQRVYKGEVTSVDSLGYIVKLTGFRKKYKGLLCKHLLSSEENLKLKRGSAVSVQVISVDCDQSFVVLSLKSIDQKPKKKDNKFEEEDMNNNNRVIRISSPERYKVKQMEGTIGVCNVKIKPDPLYLTMMGVSLSSTNSVFANVAKIPSGFMLSNAVRIRNQNFGDFKDFLSANSFFNKDWVKGELLNETAINYSSENVQEVWSSKKKNAMLIKKQRELLPIYAVRDDLIRAITDNRVLIVQGETGSGKSTQIPQYLLESGFTKNGKIVCTQPRKMAALSLATRVAEEQGVAVGGLVGYKYRFCDRTSDATLIKYCTEGTLLRECLNACHLDNYSVVIMDEAHERTTNLDVLFGYLKKEMQRNPTLRIIVSSATMEANKFSKFFDTAPVFRIRGRAFPVEIFYRPNDVYDYFNAAILTAIDIHKNKPPGDILLFLTGQDEIEVAYETFEDQINSMVPDLVVLKIFSALPYDEQVKVFEAAPPGSRKLIISTNVAETSMTIPGIVYVIDPGYAKLKMFSPKTGIEALDLLPISQASADQRTGRAGRTAPGQCYRLYTKQSYLNFLNTTIPEIQRSDLASVVLQFKAMGISDVASFQFIDAPSKEALFMAEKQLYGLCALDANGVITNDGRRMIDFPLDPKLSKMLIKSIDQKCTNEIIIIIAMLSVQNVFYRPHKKHALADSKKAEMSSPVSDHITLLNVFDLWEKNNYSNDWCKKNFINIRAMNEAFEIRDLLYDKLEQHKYEVISAGKNIERIQMAICAGFAHNVAKRNTNPRKFHYIPFCDNADSVFIHPSSALMKKNPQWVIYHTLTETTKKYIKEVTVIDPTWLSQLAPTLYEVIS